MWGPVTLSSSGWEGSSGSGGLRALTGVTEAGSRPCTWAGGLGNGVGCCRVPKAGPAGSAVPLGLRRAAGRPHGRPGRARQLTGAQHADRQASSAPGQPRQEPPSGTTFSVDSAKLYCNWTFKPEPPPPPRPQALAQATFRFLIPAGAAGHLS